eukprot:scaffold2610_cov40-Cyclotella_meneghiniana.AAC.1
MPSKFGDINSGPKFEGSLDPAQSKGSFGNAGMPSTLPDDSPSPGVKGGMLKGNEMKKGSFGTMPSKFGGMKSGDQFGGGGGMKANLG